MYEDQVPTYIQVAIFLLSLTVFVVSVAQLIQIIRADKDRKKD